MKKIFVLLFSALGLSAASQPMVTFEKWYSATDSGYVFMYDTNGVDHSFCCTVSIHPQPSNGGLQRFAGYVQWEDGSTNPRTPYDNKGALYSYFNRVPTYYYMCSCEPVLLYKGNYTVSFHALLTGGGSRDTTLFIDTAIPAPFTINLHPNNKNKNKNK